MGPAGDLEDLLALWRLKWRVLFAPNKTEALEQAIREARELKIPGAENWLLQQLGLQTQQSSPETQAFPGKIPPLESGPVGVARPPFEAVPPQPPSIPKPPFEETR